ncbi:uncharacterized protein A1O9_08461 [Exophiala aquamarina CBS 119918]|uniref:GH16 domain-containing protein n=1 Tax=Exophiala aquamarina CBS 119918 TaxID=1182545 RepID=A0A072P7A2_9EURO|nr:uncharacterized protein A1O9_08461 [Exophiala aquamarina CBS 119918]KEF55711.1 hypothetical protein A1O9_08461 [Exophiala aquamarina CBS 119918]
MRPLLLSLVAFAQFAFGQTVYVLRDDYTAGSSAGSFADNFDFFTDNDPTNGYVNYISQAAAVDSGLLSTLPDGSIYMGVDTTNVATGRGRNSIRIESKKLYNHGLFILGLAHMPGGQCATWPAFWLKGPVAQSYSELDVIEGINLDSTSVLSLKTSQACSIGQQPMTGTLQTTDCNINTGGLVGCSINSTSPSTYGTGFNQQGGGVYATEWTSDAVTIWYFARNSIPSDVLTGTPQPALWGPPLAKFVPSCRLDDSFVDQNIVMNIDFCGDYAADPYWYNQYPSCTAQATSCNAFVRDNPGAFVDTYWQINQLKVYQQSTASTTSSFTTTGSTSSTSSPSPLPASTTSGCSSSSSTTSHSEASTTSGFTATQSVTGTTSASTGIFVFTPGLPNPPSSSFQPVDDSTTTSSSPAGDISTTSAISSTAGPIMATTSSTTSLEDQPLPTFSLATTTITCPAGWPITTPFVVTKPVQPQPTGHGVIVTIDHGHEVTISTDRSGKTITITGPVDTPTETVVVPVTVLPLPLAGAHPHGPPGAPSGTLVTKTGSPSGLELSYGNGAGGGAPTQAANAPHNFPSASEAATPVSNISPGDAGGSGHPADGGSAGNNDDSNNDHLNGATGGGDSFGPGSNNGDSSDNVDSNGYGNQGVAGPSPSTWIASYTGAAATVVASSTLFLFLAIMSFIFLELSVV